MQKELIDGFVAILVIFFSSLVYLDFPDYIYLDGLNKIKPEPMNIIH